MAVKVNSTPSETQKEFSSLGEIAARIGKRYRTVHRAAKAGRIKTVRFGGSVMVPRREVDRILTHGF
jgi:excisionase family DNA binding protein